MNMRFGGVALGLLAALQLGPGLGIGPGIGSGIGSARADETYMIHGAVWDAYQGYLDKIGKGMRPGVFVITSDGLGASYTWCAETRCRTTMNSQTRALQNCEEEYGVDCVVFAVRDDIRVQYEIAN